MALIVSLPGNCVRVQTARAGYAADKLQRGKEDADLVLTGKDKNMTRTLRNEVRDRNKVKRNDFNNR